MVSFRITKNGFIGNGSGSLTGSLLGTASHAITASSVAWNDVTGKPSAYPAAAHDHTEDHLKPASVTTTGDITVGGNLIVNGSQTVIKTKNLTVKDKLIEIASGSISQAAANGAGIAIQTASAATQEGGEAASARIQYRSSDNHFTASIGFVAPSFTGSLQGTATHAKLAESAEKLSTGNVGGTGEPVYFENGIPVADSKTKGAVDWVTNNSESLLTPDEVIWKKGTGTDSVVQVWTGDFEASTPTASEYGAIATGFGTAASGMISHAEGSGTNASGMASHAEGWNTVASGEASHAEGYNTTASGQYSHAEGHSTTASAMYSHAEGYLTTASGEASHAEGSNTIASNGCEHAQGQYNHSSKNQIFSVGAGETINGIANRRNAISVLAVNNNSRYTSSFFVQNIGGYDGTNPTPGTNDLATVIGKVSSIWKKGTGQDSMVQVLTDDPTYVFSIVPTATGTGSIATGLRTSASGVYSHAEGSESKASGDYSHVEGSLTVASGDSSHAEGFRTVALGDYSHAEGSLTTASNNSHAEGWGTNASGNDSHAEGYESNASGYHSHAEGNKTNASGNGSHAEGLCTTASNDYEHAQGIYNHSSTNQIFSIGTGESDASRRNAVSVLAVKSNNNKYTSSFFVQNIGGYNGTNPTPGTNDLATVIGGLTSNTGTVTSVGVSAGTGITASVTNATTTPTISISSAQAHTHGNKAVLDGITAEMTASWKSKQDAIDDLATIRSNATNGQTAYGWGNHASAGYVKSGDITTAIDNLVAASESKWSADTNTDTKVTAVGNHYTPEQSTTKAASAGSVISGIGLDAAGHVTSITSSNSISNATNATNATIATNLGVVGNTSESVAAAIAEKWTYNEDTIKGVIVNKAVSATKLVGTSGSEGVPVYINAGVPKACQANLVSLPLSSTGATSGTVTLTPGTVHKCGTLENNLTINLDTSSIDSHEAIYCCVFNMGSTLKTITLPSGVKVVENSADLDTTGVYYEINIMNNVAIIARTAS